MKEITNVLYLVQSAKEDCVSPHSEEQIYSALENPEFENADKVHDWRNHVPQKLVEDWELLGDEARAVAFYMAELQADREEWD